jgi:MFS family permease
MISAAVLLSCMGLVSSPWILLVLRMVQGSLTGTIFSAQALVAATVPEKETARSMGLLQMSVFVGATFGPVGGGAVAQAVGYRATFAAAGILLGSGAAIVFALVREPARRPTERASGGAARASVASVLTIPAFAAALALTLLVQLSATALFPVLPLYVQDLLHTGNGVASSTGWLMAVSGMTAAAGSYAFGRLHRRTGLKSLLAASILLTSVLMVPQGLASNFASLLVFRSLATFAFGGLSGLVGALAAVSSPKNAKGTAFGLIGAASSLGFGTGPLLGGAVAAGIGIRPLFFASAAVLGIVPAVLFGLAIGLRRASRAGWKPSWAASRLPMKGE